jgi:hypothetical protein
MGQIILHNTSFTMATAVPLRPLSRNSALIIEKGLSTLLRLW